MLKVKATTQFQKDYKIALKRGCDKNKFTAILQLLIDQKPLPQNYKDHPLTNSKKYKNMRECHLTPDWLLVYQVEHDTLVLKLIRTGSHSDLF